MLWREEPERILSFFFFLLTCRARRNCSSFGFVSNVWKWGRQKSRLDAADFSHCYLSRAVVASRPAPLHSTQLLWLCVLPHGDKAAGSIPDPPFCTEFARPPCVHTGSLILYGNMWPGCKIAARPGCRSRLHPQTAGSGPTIQLPPTPLCMKKKLMIINNTWEDGWMNLGWLLFE